MNLYLDILAEIGQAWAIGIVLALVFLVYMILSSLVAVYRHERADDEANLVPEDWE